jgi:hypothetical protein
MPGRRYLDFTKTVLSPAHRTEAGRGLNLPALTITMSRRGLLVGHAIIDWLAFGTYLSKASPAASGQGTRVLKLFGFDEEWLLSTSLN